MNKDYDIINFVVGWRESKGLPPDKLLNERQITGFIGELQEQIASMDYNLPAGSTLIGYTGNSNGAATWKIAKHVSKTAGDGAVYVTDLPAGKLLNDGKFTETINELIDNENIIGKITSGYDNDIRLQGGSCGYGEYLSLNDFVSSKLMGESTGAAENLIVFAPEEIDPNKVFGTTEIESIFSNDTFQSINGISKEELSALYYAGEEGKQTVFQILSKTSREAVGDVKAVAAQATLLQKAFAEHGILDSKSSDFALNMCYDVQGRQLGVELFSKSKGTSLISDYQSGSRLVNGSDNQVVLKLAYAKAVKLTKSMTAEELAEAIRTSEVYLGEDGAVLGRSYQGTKLEGLASEQVPADYIYKAKYEVYRRFADDSTMLKRWGAEYGLLSAKEKYQARTMDCLIRAASGATKLKGHAALTGSRKRTGKKEYGRE